MLTCTCCDGICGPQSGCNCQPCQKLDAEDAAQKAQEKKSLPKPQQLLNSWTWGEQPSMINQYIYLLSYVIRNVVYLNSRS